MSDDIQRALGRIEGNVSGIKEAIEKIEKQLACYDKRIAALEQRTWKWAGGLSILLLVWGLISHKVLAAVGLK